MKYLKLVFIERLHRHVFDNYYVQNYKIKWTDRIVIKILNTLLKRNHNWRYELGQYSKSFGRYSLESRINHPPKPNKLNEI